MADTNIKRKCRPPLKDIDTALTVYYGCIEIGNKEITAMFGSMSSSTIAKMKKAVMERMAEEDVPYLGYYTVNTKVAFETWGIDVDDLEKRRTKLKKLGLSSNV